MKEVHIINVEDPLGNVHVIRLVCTAATAGIVAHLTANGLDQDAAAVYCPGTQAGWLEGRDTSAYEPFNLDLFVFGDPSMYVQTVPAHKQTDPAKAPGQIVNPIPPSKLYKPAHGDYPEKK